MSAFDLSLLDLIGALLGFVLTILVLSYIFGDNVLFRIAAHLFVGVTAGYVSTVVIQNVILPQMVFPFFEDDRGTKLFAILFLILGTLMFTKISPRLNKIGNIAVAYLVGVGAATAIGGAVVGTIFPQTSASMSVFENVSNPINAFIILFGTLTTLIYFHFGIRRKTEGQPNQPSQWFETIGKVGQVFVAITFGALFSGVYLAAITALIERASYLWNLILGLIS